MYFDMESVRNLIGDYRYSIIYYIIIFYPEYYIRAFPKSNLIGDCYWVFQITSGHAIFFVEP